MAPCTRGPQGKGYYFLVLDQVTVKLPSILGTRSTAALGLASVPVAGALGTALGVVLSPMAQAGPPAKPQEILLVSYAVTKAAYDRIIPQFTADWKKKTGQTITVRTCYGGSGSQTRAVIDGLEADVVGLAMEADVSKTKPEV